MLRCDTLRVDLDGFQLTADFTITRHTAIIGPSGSGKSTLLSVLGGFQTAAGKVLFKDTDISKAPPSERPMAQVFQDHNVFPHLTAYENVALGMKPPERAQIMDALSHVELTDYAHQKPGQLSGGQIARIALARVIVQRKPLILLDEPFAALGPALRVQMVDLTLEAAKRSEAVILMVSHNIADVERLGGDVIWIEDGVCAPPVAWEVFSKSPPQGFQDYIQA